MALRSCFSAFVIILIMIIVSPRILGETVLDSAHHPTSRLCSAAIAQVERAMSLPDGFLNAISRVETGRLNADGTISPWPWSINVDGKGYFYDSREAAIDAVHQFQALGHKSIDIGCMQVNIFYHPDAFFSLEAAFDPYTNARYAGEFLQRMRAQTGSWPRAAAAYHSQIEEKGMPYLQHVLEQWAIPQDGRSVSSTNRGKVAIEQKTLRPTTPPKPTYHPLVILSADSQAQENNSPLGSSSNKSQLSQISSVPTIHGGGINHAQHPAVEAMQAIRAQEQRLANPSFKPFKGNFRSSITVPPHQRFKNTPTGRSLQDYRKTPVHEVAPMPYLEGN